MSTATASIQELQAAIQSLLESQKETERQMRATDKKVKEAFDLFTTQWGRLIESLVEGDLIKILNQRGIPVRYTSQRVKGNHEGENYEFDIIAVNGKEIVVVEVKTTLRPDDVKDFKERLGKIKVWLSGFAENTVYGAVAYLQASAAADRMAEKDGLFLIKATGSSASIANTEDFKPKAF